MGGGGEGWRRGKTDQYKLAKYGPSTSGGIVVDGRPHLHFAVLVDNAEYATKKLVLGC